MKLEELVPPLVAAVELLFCVFRDVQSIIAGVGEVEATCRGR